MQYKYKNTRTGAILDSPCIIKGGNWEKVDACLENERLDDQHDDVITLSEMTVEGLKEFAEENGINLGKARRKEDIIKIIMESDAVEVE